MRLIEVASSRTRDELECMCLQIEFSADAMESPMKMSHHLKLFPDGACYLWCLQTEMIWCCLLLFAWGAPTISLVAVLKPVVFEVGMTLHQAFVLFLVLLLGISTLLTSVEGVYFTLGTSHAGSLHVTRCWFQGCMLRVAHGMCSR